MIRLDTDRGPERPRRQLQRIFTLIELIANRRFTFPIRDIVRELNDTDACCDRTVRRDLELLATLGLVERERPSFCEQCICFDAVSLSG